MISAKEMIVVLHSSFNSQIFCSRSQQRDGFIQDIIYLLMSSDLQKLLEPLARGTLQTLLKEDIYFPATGT